MEQKKIKIPNSRALGDTNGAALVNRPPHLPVIKANDDHVYILMNPDFLSLQETKGKPIISVLTDEELCQMSNMSARLSTLAKVRHVRTNLTT